MTDHVKQASPTPYDDVFRTILTDCSSLAIPLVNEVFGESYTGKEEIELLQNERFIRGTEDEEIKRVTDSYFFILRGVRKYYHIECQSTDDGSMLIRMFEYDTQIAIDQSVYTADTLTVNFPESGIIYLRHAASVPDKVRVILHLPGGKTASYEMPTLKVREYTLDEIFDKRLYFLVPFHIFVYENRFRQMETDEEELTQFLSQITDLRDRVEVAHREGNLSTYEAKTLIAMAKKSGDAIAAHYESVRKGVDEIMGGHVLEYEAKDILNQGREEGRNEGRREGRREGRTEGRTEGRIEMVETIMKNSGRDLAYACALSGMSEEEYWAGKNRLQTK